MADDPSWRFGDAWGYGGVYVLETLWERLGIAGIIRKMAGGRALPLRR